ncbi:hypothetical protein LV651_003432 [Escherichia coli]|nr:deoC/LacD aldolase [Escherichia coli]EFA6883806.1 deoC/LacD aldolase [Escherichia coli]EGO4365241.1 deoC/LacD aldolase [Escherichia coli]EIQ9108192.1 hypothetical protein [Escherichia coli]
MADLGDIKDGKDFRTDQPQQNIPFTLKGCGALDWGMPTMAVTGVGKDMVRDQRYFSLATRIAAEMGAQIIKTYYVEKGFERIVAGCPVPIVIAGGKKLPEREALEMCWQAIDQGASGVDMGRNIFQSDHPVAMMKAVQAVVHHNETADRAYELYLSEKQ